MKVNLTENRRKKHLHDARMTWTNGLHVLRKLLYQLSYGSGCLTTTINHFWHSREMNPSTNQEFRNSLLSSTVAKQGRRPNTDSVYEWLRRAYLLDALHTSQWSQEDSGMLLTYFTYHFSWRILTAVVINMVFDHLLTARRGIPNKIRVCECST